MQVFANGSVGWWLQKGTEGADAVGKLQVDANKDIFLAGTTAGDMDGHLSEGQEDIVVMKFTGRGEWQWTAQSGTVGADAVTAMQVDKSGEVYVAGDTLDAKEHPGVGDIFLKKHAPLWDSSRWSLSEMRQRSWQPGHVAKIPASHGLGSFSFAAAASHELSEASWASTPSTSLVFTAAPRSLRLGAAFVRPGGMADLPAVSTGPSVLAPDAAFPVGAATESAVAVHPGCPGEPEPYLVVKFEAHNEATLTGSLLPLGIARCGGVEVWVYKNARQEDYRPGKQGFALAVTLKPCRFSLLPGAKRAWIPTTPTFSLA